jgi:hypothetical protein
LRTADVCCPTRFLTAERVLSFRLGRGGGLRGCAGAGHSRPTSLACSTRSRRIQRPRPHVVSSDPPAGRALRCRHGRPGSRAATPADEPTLIPPEVLPSASRPTTGHRVPEARLEPSPPPRCATQVYHPAVPPGVGARGLPQGTADLRLGWNAHATAAGAQAIVDCASCMLHVWADQCAAEVGGSGSHRGLGGMPHATRSWHHFATLWNFVESPIAS